VHSFVEPNNGRAPRESVEGVEGMERHCEEPLLFSAAAAHMYSASAIEMPMQEDWGNLVFRSAPSGN
jgi:hypothetical protein